MPPLPVHPEHPLVQVPTHIPVQAPLHEEVEAVIVSPSIEVNTACIFSAVTPDSIKSPALTIVVPPKSFTFNKIFTVFSPCSAFIIPPETGVSVKSYVEVPYSDKEP